MKSDKLIILEPAAYNTAHEPLSKDKHSRAARYAEFLSSFQQHSLQTQSTLALMNRIDTKYVLSKRLLNDLFDALKNDYTLLKIDQDCIFTSGLGSAEANLISLFVADKNTRIAGSNIPVGYPAEGVEVLLLDDAQEEVGLGEVGEIAVKSRYLAQGYWNAPDLTKMKFLPDPDGTDECIYMTGDLGRMLPDGCLIHMGRKDFQVKIRGYKVFLAEVEAAAMSAVPPAADIKLGLQNFRD